MSDEIISALAEFVRESLELRVLAEMPVTDSAPAEVLGSLRDVRRRLDRTEEILARAVRLKARAHRAATLANASADDAWDQAIRRTRAAPIQAGGEYSSARERHAEANLAILDLRHAARRATDLAHHCDEAVDVIRLAHRGLEGARQDTLAVLRAYAFESHLER